MAIAMMEPTLPIWMMETMCARKWQLGIYEALLSTYKMCSFRKYYYVYNLLCSLTNRSPNFWFWLCNQYFKEVLFIFC